MRSTALLFGLALTAWSTFASAAEPTKDEAQAALKKGVAFLQSASAEGAYLWRYSEDLSLREGEGAASATMGWVQPPGTPSVGEALLLAYQRTGEPYLLAAATQAAHALVRGQLLSGGWDYRLEIDPKKRKNYAFRVDANLAGKNNVTTLDDNTTQSALRFLMHVDRHLGQKDEAIHGAVVYALEHLLTAQYPNGGWPQRFREPPRAEDFPVVKANYPPTWPREWPGADYRTFYTLNDNALADTIATMFEAAAIYGDERYSAAARRGGDFLILAQMPDPQPAWAQQYNAQMQPAWARKFEPPSVTGGESQGAIKILMEVYRQTGDKKYLAPIPRALEYLEKTTFDGDRLARFNELQTNKPLYFTKQYELVYTKDDLPTHYGFIVGTKVPQLRAEFDKLQATAPADLKPAAKTPQYSQSKSLRESARQVIDSLDSRGAWVEDGKLKDETDEGGKVKRIIDTRTFIKNLDTLGKFIAASK